MQRRLWDVRDARNAEHLLRKAQKRATPAVTDKAPPHGAYDSSQPALGVGHGASGFNVCPAGFQSCFGSVPVS